MNRDRLTMATGIAVSISHGGSLTAFPCARLFDDDDDEDDDDDDDDDDEDDDDDDEEKEDEECTRRAASRMLPFCAAPR